MVVAGGASGSVNASCIRCGRKGAVMKKCVLSVLAAAIMFAVVGCAAKQEAPVTQPEAPVKVEQSSAETK